MQTPLRNSDGIYNAFEDFDLTTIFSDDEDNVPKKRIDKTIGRKLLKASYNKTFRLTMESTCILCQKDAWELLINDLRIIGFLKNHPSKTYETLPSMSCTNLVMNGNLYRIVMHRLPLKYAVRFAIYRLICSIVYWKQCTVENETRNPETIIFFEGDVKEKIVQFFRNSILAIEPFQRGDKEVPYAPQGGALGIKKLRIQLNQTIPSVLKTWRPTVLASTTVPLLNSCQTINWGTEHLFFNIQPSAAIATDNYFFQPLKKRKRHRDSQKHTLASYKWVDSAEETYFESSISTIRLKLMRLLCSSAGLCGLFALKQIYGNEDYFITQCKLINKFIHSFDSNGNRSIENQANPL